MLFIEWWQVWRVCIGVLVALLVAATATLGFWSVRKRKLLVRLSVQLICTMALIALCGAFFIFSIVFALPGNVYSEPVYSPNRKMAVRIMEYNASGLGGAEDSVELFSDHGFRSAFVFVGDYKSVESANLRWKSDSELEIPYEGTAHLCSSTPRVSVNCVSR